MSGPGDIDDTDRPGDDPALGGDEALAAEYVLGVLDHAARLAATQRLRGDAAFAALVADWQARLAPLADEVLPEAAPDLMDRVEARLFGQQPPAPGPLAQLRGWLLGAAAAVAVVAGAMLVIPPAGPAGPQMVAELRAEGSDLVVAASWDAGGLTLRRMAGPAPAGNAAHELWLIGADGVPVSLGLIEGSPYTMPLDELRAGETLAISLEPAGGSPVAGPTGPVIAAGVVTNL